MGRQPGSCALIAATGATASLLPTLTSTATQYKGTSHSPNTHPPRFNRTPSTNCLQLLAHQEVDDVVERRCKLLCEFAARRRVEVLRAASKQTSTAARKVGCVNTACLRR